MIDIYVYINILNIHSNLQSGELRENFISFSDLRSEVVDDDTKTQCKSHQRSF